MNAYVYRTDEGEIIVAVGDSVKAARDIVLDSLIDELGRVPTQCVVALYKGPIMVVESNKAAYLPTSRDL